MVFIHGLYHILLVVYGPQYTTQNMVQPVYDSRMIIPVDTQQNSWKPSIILLMFPWFCG